LANKAVRAQHAEIQSLQSHISDLDRKNAMMRVQFEDEKRRQPQNGPVHTEPHGVKRLRDDTVAIHSPYAPRPNSAFPLTAVHSNFSLPPKQVEKIVQEATGTCDIDIAAPDSHHKGDDWAVAYNSTTPRTVDVSLSHTLDHATVVCCARFSHDGTMLATGCSRSAQVFDAASGEKIAELCDEGTKDGEVYIRSVCFSPDGKYLATGAEDRVIRVWDLTSKLVRFALHGHDQNIYSLDWSRDGKYLVSGSGDKSVKIWDMESGRALKTMMSDEDRSMPHHAGAPKESGVTSVAFNPHVSQLVATVRCYGGLLIIVGFIGQHGAIVGCKNG